MPTLNDLFPSKHLSAVDLGVIDHAVQIKAIVPEEEVGVQKDVRPILFFNEFSKGLVLNRTNAKRIAKLYGEELNEWIGRRITIYPSECDFKDTVVACIRVRQDAPKITDTIGHRDAGELTDDQLEELLRRRKARA